MNSVIHEAKSYAYLIQPVSIALQQGNAAAVMAAGSAAAVMAAGSAAAVMAAGSAAAVMAAGRAAAVMAAGNAAAVMAAGSAATLQLVRQFLLLYCYCCFTIVEHHHHLQYHQLMDLLVCSVVVKVQLTEIVICGHTMNITSATPTSVSCL